jgi:peptide/nickel transport system substrate-binding protein
MRRRQFIRAASTAAIAATPAAARAQGDNRPVLRIAVADLPPTLEPARELSNVGTRVTYSIFDTLIVRDFASTPDGGGSRLVPGLAVAWTRGGPQELTLRLREGVKFHDGSPFTAEDVVYTFTSPRMFGEKPLMPEAKTYFPTLESVTALEPMVVRMRTSAPDVLLEQRLASWCGWIVSKRAYEERGFEGFGRAPVGTGPYRLRELKGDDRIVLDAHDEYWQGRPTARQVVFWKVPELAARVAALQAGDVEMITTVGPDQVASFRGRNDLDVRSVVLANTHMLTFDDRGVALGDKRVRQALGLAIDRQLLVDTLWDGKAVVPPSHNYPEYGDMFLTGRVARHDPDRARRLLREAGYRGEKIVYRTMPNYYTNALKAAQAMVPMWQAVGVNAELQVVENFTQMNGPGAQIGNWSNSTRLPDPLGALWLSWGPGGPLQARKAWNTADEFNRLGRALEAEVDPAARRALFARLLDVWEDEAPGTVLYQPGEFYVVRRNVRWRPYTFYFMDLRPANLAFVSS